MTVLAQNTVAELFPWSDPSQCYSVYLVAENMSWGENSLAPCRERSLSLLYVIPS